MPVNKFFRLLIMFSALGCGQSLAQEQDEIDPAALRPYWLGQEPGTAAATAPYILSAEERAKFNGTFGIDLSHYSFDIDNDDPVCKTQQGYESPACSCTIDWQAVADNQILFAYSKASDAANTDLSFRRVWSELKAKHDSKVLFRGAFHFLRPSVDAATQARTFLNAVGAVGGRKPAQLPPVLDIEWSNKRITPGTPEFDACPTDRRTTNDQGKTFCDMWYKVHPEDIAVAAKIWIDIVEYATGQQVIIYTNPTAWWNPVMKAKGADLMKRQPVWTSRYTSQGPRYNPKWDDEGGSPKWKMAPIPMGATFPAGSKYDIAHFWQFSEAAYLPPKLFTCGGNAVRKAMDMNWVPVDKNEYLPLFGVGTP
ncbi:hypothetical protein IVB41_15940 [Bradyrhizobium sp. 44]|uniref:glycoside hydrolase family 25 protein n=1 Tax=Bradyrhizobium sp. 44 TaxID=2782675 RepID=UPI001FFB1DA4|nr:GH25 family lysozyme [Bradyrhizobium sp. 44]MCK1285412.1 hypothetical protein [Bradyrhizobium sp. 44]